MNLKRTLVLAVLCLSVPVFAAAATVDLVAAERIALERNLDLRAQVLDTRASEALVRKGYGIYDPKLEVFLGVGDNRERLNFQGFGPDRSEVEFRNFNFSLGQKLPWGTDLSVEFVNRRQRSNPPPNIDPSYISELKFTLIQPLLKNFGRTVTEQQILFAAKDREAAVEDLREQAFQLVASVRDAYFDVLQFRDNLVYRQTSVALAAKVLEENQARVDAGVLPPVEVLEAEVGLKARERELLDAEREYRDSLDNLSVLLNIPDDLQVKAGVLGEPMVDASENHGFQSALEKRPDLLRRIKEIERLNLERRVIRNQLLPALDFSASYSHKGLGEEYSDDLDDIASNDFRNWEVGVAISYPLGNREARNEYKRAGLQLKGLHARLGQLREEIRTEIRAAIRLLEVSSKKIEVAQRGRELAEEKLRMLLKRKEVGLATTRQVLEGEEDLALARTDQIAALADYNKAITEYLRVSGLLLETEGIHISGPLDLDGTDSLLQMN